MQKVKILYGIEAAGGGALKHLVYLATRLDSKYFTITVILSNLRNENIDYEIIKLKNAGVKIVIMPIRRNIHVSDIIILFDLIVYMRKGKYDIVHAHSSKAGALFRLAAWLCRIPIVFYTPHCFYFQGKDGFKRCFFLLLEKLLAKLTTGIILSENEKEQAIQNKVIDVDKLYNINNAIDLSDYVQFNNKKDSRLELGIPMDSVVIAGIGRLEKQKGWGRFIEIAIEMMSLNPDTFFIIAGEGPLMDELIYKIPDKYITRFKFLGYIDKISIVYQVSDAILSTSLYEGLPYVYIEAIKLNKKLITTCYIKDLEEYRNKQYFPVEGDNNRDVAIEINRLIYLQSYANNGFERFEERFLNLPLFIKEHQNLYRNCFELKKQNCFNDISG